MINIVVPMAGRGSRFSSGRERVPKPLIQVTPGRRMIEYVVRYLALAEPHQFIFVCLDEHARAFDFDAYFRSLGVTYELVIANEPTRGPAATALLAAPFIGNDDELLVAYCDSFLTVDAASFLNALRGCQADGGILTYRSANPMDSYAEVDPAGRVRRTAEKVAISETATAGFYYFREGLDFVTAARAFAAGNGAAGELFVCPVYNFLIRDGKTVVAHPIGAEQQIEMGTPEDLTRARQWLVNAVAPQFARLPLPARRAWRRLSLALYGRSFLIDLYAAAAEAGVRPFLMWGTLLGYVREGRLMRHDTDLDVGIVAADYGQKDALIAALAKRGHLLARDEPYKLKFLHSGRILSLDVDVFYPWNGRMVCSTFRRGRIAGETFDLDAFDILREVSFLDGVCVLVPDQPAKVLEAIYGDWQTRAREYRSKDGPRNRVYWSDADGAPAPLFPSPASVRS